MGMKRLGKCLGGIVNVRHEAMRRLLIATSFTYGAVWLLGLVLYWAGLAAGILSGGMIMGYTLPVFYILLPCNATLVFGCLPALLGVGIGWMRDRVRSTRHPWRLEPYSGSSPSCCCSLDLTSRSSRDCNHAVARALHPGVHLALATALERVALE